MDILTGVNEVHPCPSRVAHAVRQSTCKRTYSSKGVTPHCRARKDFAALAAKWADIAGEAIAASQRVAAPV